MKKFFILFTIISIGKFSQGQATPNPSDYSKTIDIIPPAPNAAALGKYGELIFGLSAGSMNYSLPIYQFISADISLPISISYNSSGIKVDEIGSRIGVSWALNAGGVITRTVYGRADELGTRAEPPSDFPSHTSNLISFMDDLALSDENGGGKDAQPDLFSFNFNNTVGKFILDSSSNVILLSHTDIKIETSLSSSVWNFKLITSDGVQYFFGGDSAIETTSKNTVGSGCGKGSFSGVPTAYYLKTIVHPNNDTVNFVYSRFGFTYKTGTIETIYNRDQSYLVPCGGVSPNPPSHENSTCVSLYTTSGVLLTEINSTSTGNSIKFFYGSRIDIGDKSLAKIEVYQSNNSTPIKVFSLQYQYSHATSFTNSYSISDTSLLYRLFLSKVIETDSDSSLTKVFQFSYHDLNGLPPRLSYSQDDYGIFNGKNNTTLIPTPSYLAWQDALPQATANRSVDSVYAIKGLLNKIVYPTGGSDSIVYESNSIYTSVPIPLPLVAAIADTSSGSFPGPIITKYSDTIIVSLGQQTHLLASCEYTGPANEYDPIHCHALVYFIDLTTSSTIFSNTTFSCGSTPINQLIDLQAGHSYIIKVEAAGHHCRVSASLQYQYGVQTYQAINKPVGGMRVQKIITTDSVSPTISTKRYIYASLDNQSHSSGGLIYSPRYDKYLITYVTCTAEGQLPSCDFAQYAYYTMFSYSQNNIYTYSSTPVSYSSVLESFGENFENGGIEHLYTVVPDDLGINVFGDIIPGSPTGSNAWQNGREFYQQIFKKEGSIYLPVKKIYTHYRDDSRIDTSFYSYIVNKKYTPGCTNDPPNVTQIDAYDLFKYPIFRKWTYIDTLRTLTYDNSGQNYIADTTITEYANVNHALPTKILTTGSDRKVNTVNNYYPQDLTLTGAEETARQNLISRHITSPILEVQVLKDTAQVMKAKINYNVFANGLVLPKEQFVQTLDRPIEKRVEFFRYNSFGKILEQGKSSDIRNSYIWDYNSLYPIAEIRNADSVSVAYTSFEADGKGGWIYSGSVSTDVSAPTGTKCYSLSGNSISKSGLNTSGNYIVSYWSKNGPQTLSHSTETLTGRAIGNWTYYEHLVSNPSGGTVTVYGSGTIDELRLYPKEALMTTFTYLPLIGISSLCDANNRITYYEYDALGRLKLIRDLDKNILKRIDYKYKATAQQ